MVGTILQNANTGEIVYFDANGTAEEWSSRNLYHGRVTMGKFTNEPGWQLIGNNNQTRTTPIGVLGGLRQYERHQIRVQSFHRHQLYHQLASQPHHAGRCGQQRHRRRRSNVTLQDSDGKGGKFTDILKTQNTLAQGGTKGQPAIKADILGDYREELVLGTTNEAGPELRIYFNAEDSTHKLLR